MELPTLFFEHHPNPMLVFDARTLQILEVNKRAIRKYGFSRDEFRRLSLEDIHPPEELPLLRRNLDDPGPGGARVDLGPLRHRTKSGRMLHVGLSVQRIDLPHHPNKGRVVHVNDVTETVLLKNKVEEAYTDQQHHINNNPLGMVKYDENLRIIEWSKRAEEKTGYLRDEVLGKGSCELPLFNESGTISMKKRLEILAGGDAEQDRFETQLRLKNGELMEVRIHASTLRSPKGDLKSVLAFIENITERKEHKQQLAQRERKYHSLFEDANDGIFLMSDMTVVDCNQRAAEILCSSKQAIIGKSPLDFSPEQQPDGYTSLAKARQKMDRAQQGEPQVFEWRHLTSDGRQVDVEVSLNSIELGDSGYVQAIIRDLSEHKKAKQILEAERQRLERAQNMARLGWWDYHVEDDSVTGSEVLFEILKLQKTPDRNLSLRDFQGLVHPEDQPILDGVIRRARQSNRTFDFMLRLVRGDDRYIHARCRAQSTFGEKGEMIQLSGVLQDVTIQQKAEQELRRREELFESLFINAPVAIVMVDVKGNVQKVNNSFETLFEYQEEELLGKELLPHLLTEQDYEEAINRENTVFRPEGKATYYEGRRLTKNGVVKNLFIGSLPVFIDGEPIAAFGIYTDITKLRSTEQSLKSSVREQEVLLAEIHHRVKNNLAIISGLLELEAMSWEQDTTVHKVLMQSKLRIHSMAQIHEKLYRSGNFSNLNLENYIGELVDTIYESMKGQEKEVVMTVRCDDVYLNINQALPCALLVNELVTNAFKYAFDEDREGQLDVRFISRDDVITVEVKDNGPGLPKAFEALTAQSLGHRLVQQLVKQLEGQIKVDSAPDEGTHYRITFEKAEKSGSAGHYLI